MGILLFTGKLLIFLVIAIIIKPKNLRLFLVAERIIAAINPFNSPIMNTCVYELVYRMPCISPPLQWDFDASFCCIR